MQKGVLILAIFAFVSIFLFVIVVIHYLRGFADKQQMLSKIREGYGKKDKIIDYDPAPKGKFQISKFFSVLGSRLLQQESDTYSETKLMFLKAGYHNPNTPYIFWGVKAFLLLLLPTVFIVGGLPLLPHLSFALKILYIAIIAVVAFYVPNVWLRIHTERRQDSIRNGMPDALDMLVVCVEAGMGLDAAINKVGEEIHLASKELSSEFKLLSTEIRMGKSRSDALRNLALRTQIDEVRTLTTILIQTERFGTSVARALRTCSDSSRTQRFQRAEEMAAKMAVKLTFPLIFFIFPSLFVVILGPAMIRVYLLFTGAH